MATMLQIPDIMPSADIAPSVSYRLQCVDRVLSILELMGKSEVPLSLAEICRRVNMHKSTVHRALMVLERGMLLERTPKNSFRLGLKLYDWGNRAVQQMDLRTRIRPFSRRLATQLGETVHLGVLQNASVVYLDKNGTRNRACSGSKTGASNPAYCTSLGKAMMAWLPPAAANALVDQIKFVPLTDKTIRNREKLLEVLERVRRRGYSIDDEEVEVGVRCIGAPIFNESHLPIAALSISTLASRLPPHRVPVLANRLLRCCAEVSASLGIRHQLHTRNVGHASALRN